MATPCEATDMVRMSVMSVLKARHVRRAVKKVERSMPASALRTRRRSLVGRSRSSMVELDSLNQAGMRPWDIRRLHVY
jgi:hypothetical protein